jgi:diguanylate cyclase (GGDEF)-like protein
MPATPPAPAVISPLAEGRSLRAFIISVSLAVAVCISGAFLGIALRTRTLIKSDLLNRARTDFRTIVHFRAWNASFGGVYVEKRAGIESNPYLVKPDIQGIDGRWYTKKNPATMTRELSERLKQSEGYGFHITSLNPLNPGNQADVEESAALRSFVTGNQERIWSEEIGGRTYTRYMAPLKVDQTCLECHAQQGYKVGDIRGGISFTYDPQEIQEKLRTNLYLVGALALLTTSLLMGLVVVFFRQLVRKLAEARRQLETLATTDPLTGLYNRRQIIARFEEECGRAQRGGLGLSCIMLDVDHFKRVNDTFGHLQGDEVLKMIATQARASLRAYDLVGRYGGEEFIALLPGTELDTARSVAERLRLAIAACGMLRTPTGQPQPTTVSLGLTEWRMGDTMETLVHRADEALYRAKANGRNRVEVVEQ